MAIQQKASDRRLVRLDMSVEHRMILRSRIENWRSGEREDLERPDTLRDPAAARRRVATYDRLIEALWEGRISLPDEEARLRISEAQAGLEETERWEEAKIDHDSLTALLSALGGSSGPELRPPAVCAASATTLADDLQMEAAVLARVLNVHPAHLSVAELVRELVGGEAEFGERDAVERATHELSRDGLLHHHSDLVTPTRAALRGAELQDR